MSRRLALAPTTTGIANFPWRINLPANVSSSGKRERRFFKTKIEADTFARQQKTRLENFGRNSSTLTPGQQEDAAMAFVRLAPHGVSLNTVVAEYLQRHDAHGKSVTFAELFERFMESKKGKSEAYLRGLKYTLPRFPRLHARTVCDIAPDEIDAEMNAMTPAARNAFMRNLRAAFNFGVKRGWLESNPVEKLDFSDIKKGEVQTLTPKESAALMAAAESEMELLPFHALGLFAGIRPMELERLEWRHVDLAERHVEITADVSKTGRRRIIEMQPNLHAWLTRYVEHGGRIEGKVTPPANLRTRLRAIRESAGLGEWIQDVMRHSYASYHLAEHGDIDRLTLSMGHESATMLWKHYNRAAKRKDAAAFWKIMPSVAAAGKVVSMVA